MSHQPDIDRVIAAGPFEATWESLVRNYRVPRWYQDGKFGIFIHWGLYSVPAFGNEWYPREMYQQGSKVFEHHIKTYGPQAQFGYKDFIPRFTAAEYHPAEWAQLFKQAGARFIVPVAEHHDGFAMYDSALTEWSAAKMGPKRDLVGELAQAVRAAGMTFGLSSHRAENVWFYDGGRAFPSDVQDEKNRGLYGIAQPKPEDQFDLDGQPHPPKEHLDDWLLRCCELVDKYQPQIFWFDWWIQHYAFKPYLPKFAAYYYNRAASWGRGVAINYKYDAYPLGSGVWDVERGQAPDIRADFWQTDTSVSRNSWGYIEGHKYKEVSSILHDLIDIVSKNGAMLLNIGPNADGTIPEPEQRMLLDIGKWLSVNGEAIYSTRPWKTFGEGPTQVGSGSFTDTKRAAFTGQDIRFTTRDDALYATMLGWPDGGQVVIRSLGSQMRLRPGEIRSARMLGVDTPLKFTRDVEGLRVELPGKKPCEHAFVLKIE